MKAKPKPKRELLSVLLDQPVKSKLRERAKQSKRTMSQQAELIIEAGLNAA